MDQRPADDILSPATLARLRASGGGPGVGAVFSTEASPDDIEMLGAIGLEPLGAIQGSSVHHIGWLGPVNAISTEVPGLTRSLYTARRFALARLAAAADVLGATGVVGVVVVSTNRAFGSELIEVVASGNAVRPKATTPGRYGGPPPAGAARSLGATGDGGDWAPAGTDVAPGGTRSGAGWAPTGTPARPGWAPAEPPPGAGGPAARSGPGHPTGDDLDPTGATTVTSVLTMPSADGSDDGAPAWTTMLDPAGLAGALRCGLAPVSVVFGTCVHHLASRPVPETEWPGQEIPGWTQAVADAREVALARMQAEAQRDGADGVVQLRRQELDHGWGGQAVEYLATGSAVRRVAPR